MKRHFKHGFSLLELLAAMAIGGVLIVGVQSLVQHLQNNKKHVEQLQILESVRNDIRLTFQCPSPFSCTAGSPLTLSNPKGISILTHGQKLGNYTFSVLCGTRANEILIQYRDQKSQDLKMLFKTPVICDGL